MTERAKLRISTRVMYDELVRQRAKVKILDAASSMLEFDDTSGISHLLYSTSSDKSNSVGTLIAHNKSRGTFIARDLGVPVPDDQICNSFDDAVDFFGKHGLVVLKPVDKSGGTGVTTHIDNVDALRTAYTYAKLYSDKVIVQKHIGGSDIRLLIVAGTFRSAIERRPASVIGDGISSIRMLIDTENTSSSRTNNYMTTLSRINMDSAESHLADRIESIPIRDSVTIVVGPANLSLGGTAHEATQLVPDGMIRDAEKIARRLGLGICGVDMMWDQTSGTYAFIEVNATPGIDLHNDPFWGTKTDAIEHYVTWLLDPAGIMAA